MAARSSRSGEGFNRASHRQVPTPKGLRVLLGTKGGPRWIISWRKGQAEEQRTLEVQSLRSYYSVYKYTYVHGLGRKKEKKAV